MRHDRTEPTANALARGPAKTQDIEATRHELDDVERRVARGRKVAAKHKEREVASRQRPAPSR